MQNRSKLFPMRNSFSRTTAILILFVCALAIVRAQQREPERRHADTASPVVLFASIIPQQNGNEPAKQVLDRIETSIAENNIKALSPFFGSKVFLSLLNGKEGYFSAEQCFLILKNFFLNYSPVSFSFSNTAAESANPYGVGTLHYINRGQRGKAQLFVSLTHNLNDWRISQITIANR